MQELVDFFQTLFESINIYKMILVYSSDYDIDTLIKLLIEKDFPISKSCNERIYATDNFTSSTDLTDITCIICTDQQIYHQVRQVLKNVESMILFSFK